MAERYLDMQGDLDARAARGAHVAHGTASDGDPIADDPRLLELAGDIMRMSKGKVTVAYRFLARPASQLPTRQDRDVILPACDGRVFAYNPLVITRRYRDTPDEVVRDYLHSLFHCLLGHPFGISQHEREEWDLACDIICEAAVLELVDRRFASQGDGVRRDIIRRLERSVTPLTPSKLYRHLEESGMSSELSLSAALFMRDDHTCWYPEHTDDENPRDDDETKSLSSSDGEGDEGQGHDDSDGRGDEGHEDDTDERDDGRQDGASEGRCDEDRSHQDKPDDETGESWRQAARRLEVEREAVGAQQGEGSGDDILTLNLRRAAHRHEDYADFLRRFSVMGEHLKVDDDQFDYIFYTLGLDLFGDMPLIEPLEYSEERLVRSFVIAVDTSGSTSGDLVRHFLERTYRILKSSEYFFDKVDIHIVQCDARIQRDDVITSLSMLEQVASSFTLCGGGGTDFAPVFSYVDTLIDEGRICDLRGLIYFTDGLGHFPERAPSYDAVFVFLDEGYLDPPVPPWAYKVCLDADGVEHM